MQVLVSMSRLHLSLPAQVQGPVYATSFYDTVGLHREWTENEWCDMSLANLKAREAHAR